jgi:hypothetical protein
MKHLYSNNILYDLQHGFRKARSCESQLLQFIQELNANNNKNIQTDLIIMNFAKAFDKVSHRRLLYKLKYYGIQAYTLSWIQTFLTDITQTVVIDGVISNTVPVTGVPQGTVLVPIIFLIYINDFPEYLTHSKLRVFADDSIIYKEIACQDDRKKLQSDLDAAARWEVDWLMACHPYKCTILTITQNKTPFKHDYILHNRILKPVTSAKYLGVTQQSNLKWNTNTDNITSNGNKSLGYLKRNLQISNPEEKSRAYQALVRPKLECSCSIWDPYTHDNINKLEMVHRRAVRYVQNNYHNTSSVTSMINTIGWPTLTERRLKTRLIMMYKIAHALIAIPNNILIPTDSRTRKSHNQTVRHITTQKDTYKWSFFPHTTVQWNILPQTIISSPSIYCFREQLTPVVLLNI